MPIRPENRDRYPADWKLRSFFVRFVRARGRCEWCGAVNGRPHPVTGSVVVTTTAHVYDERPEACSLLNLAALCQKCHNGHDAAGRRQRRRERIEAASGQMRFGLPPCPDCGKPLADDWHGVAACFCRFGGRPPVINPTAGAK